MTLPEKEDNSKPTMKEQLERLSKFVAKTGVPVGFDLVSQCYAQLEDEDEL